MVRTTSLFSRLAGIWRYLTAAALGLIVAAGAVTSAQASVRNNLYSIQPTIATQITGNCGDGGQVSVRQDFFYMVDYNDYGPTVPFVFYVLSNNNEVLGYREQSLSNKMTSQGSAWITLDGAGLPHQGQLVVDRLENRGDASPVGGQVSFNDHKVLGNLDLAPPSPDCNAAPSFDEGSSTTVNAFEDGGAFSLDTALAVTDTDGGDTLTWSVASAPADGSLNGFSAQATSQGGSNTPSGLTYTPASGFLGTDTFSINVADQQGAGATISVTVQVAARPRITTVEAVDSYAAGIGERLEARITFDQDITVTGQPTLTFDINGALREVDIYSAGADLLRFRYYVVEGDGDDPDGFSIPAGALELNGATIVAAGSGAPAMLSHGEATGGRMVDATRPVVREVSAPGPFTSDTTPSLTIDISEAVGLKAAGGSSCMPSQMVFETPGEHTFDLRTSDDGEFEEGTYSDCAFFIVDGASNSTELTVSAFTVDQTAPAISVVSAVTVRGADATPSLGLSVSEPGEISVGGSCGTSSPTTLSSAGEVSIDLTASDNVSPLMDGTYSDCTVSFVDRAGNVSNTLDLAAFTVDTQGPVVSETTPVASPTNDATPAYEILIDSAGTLTVDGSCGTSDSTALEPGSHTLTLTAPDGASPLADGTYGDCTISVADDLGNALAPLTVSAFEVDTQAPRVLAVIRQSPEQDVTGADALVFRVSFTEAGLAPVTGDFMAVGSTASATEVHAVNSTTVDVTLSGGDLAELNGEVGLGFASGHAIEDPAGNRLASTTPSGVNETYTLDNTAPQLTQAGAFADAFNGSPSFRFETTEPGTLTVGGGCSTSTPASVASSAGEFAVTLTAPGGGQLHDGFYDDCWITITDAVGAASEHLPVPDFTMDTAKPVPTLSRDGSGGVTEAFELTVTFSEPVTGFGLSDLAVANGSASGLSGSGHSYSATITPEDDGKVTVDIAAEAAQDPAGNTSTAASQLVVWADITAPVVEVETFAPATALSASSYDVAVRTNEAGELTLVATSDGGAGEVRHTATIYGSSGPSLDLSSLPDGRVTLSATVTDPAGLVSEPATATFVKDTVRPEPILTAGEADPVTGTFTVTVRFSEPPTANVASTAILTENATLSDLAQVDGVVTFDVTPTAAGAVRVGLRDNATRDAVGNSSIRSEILERTHTPYPGPSVESVTAYVLPQGQALRCHAPCVTDADTIGFAVELAAPFRAEDFDAPASAFSLVGVDADSAHVSVYTSDPATLLVTFSGGGVPRGNVQGVSLAIDPSQVRDGADYPLTSASPTGANETVELVNDVVSPDVTIASDAADPVSGAFAVTVTFSENVTAFDVSDLTVTNGSAGGFRAVSAAEYTATITPDADGPVTVDIAAGAAEDLSANPNTAAETFSIMVDGTAPGVSITTRSSDPVSGAFSIFVSFTEPVHGFELSDLAVANGTASELSGSGDSYSVTITPASDGPVTVEIAAGAAQDAAGNANLAAETFSITADGTAPGVSIATRSSDPVSGAFSISVSFTEPVHGFELSDLAVANGTLSDFSGAGDGYSATITPSGDGVVTVDIGAGAAVDAAGNANTAANQFSITADGTAPGVSIATRSSDPVSGAFSISVSFTEPVHGFELSDLVVANATLSDFSGAGDDYSATVTPQSDGVVTVDIPAGAAEDAAGNASTAAAQFSIESDRTAPGVTLSTEAGIFSGAFVVTATFSEDVSGFVDGDVVAANAVVSDFTATNASVYRFTVTPAADGEVSVDIPASVAEDAAGNPNTVAETLVIEADATAPTLAVGGVEDTVTGPFTATFTFSEKVSGFELADIAAVNAVASDFDGDGAVYTARITPSGVGELTLTVAAGAAEDAAGNVNAAVNIATRVEVESTTVEVTVASTVADPGEVAASATIKNPGAAPIPFTATADVPWIEVDPSSGTIPSLGDLELNVTVNDAVNDLEPGDYTGTVTVSVQSPSGPAGAMTAQSTASTVLVEIPISLAVEERFGSITLVATTPSGLSGEATFTYASDVEAFDGLSLTTSTGRAQAESGELLFGTYDIRQALPAGWRVDDLTCSGDQDGGSTLDAVAGQARVDLDPGESLVCTFENVRDEDAVRLATQRAIRGFMVRRADRIVEAAPDLSRRFSERDSTQRGAFAADFDGSGRRQMSLSGSLSGMRNAAAADTPAIAGVTNYERPVLEGWDIWFAAELSGVTDNRAGERAESDFGVAQLGLDYQLSDTLILGLMAQYDWMEETAEEIFVDAGAVAGAHVEGEGWMAGPYAVWRIRDSLIFDALAMYGLSDNSVDPLGLYEDDFETARYMIRANLTGEFVSGAWRLRPQAGLTHYEETQDDYVDSLGITIPEQTVALGRFRAGPEIAWRHDGARGGFLELTTALNAVWDYQTAELFNGAGLLVGGDDDLRADARFGLSTLTPWGAFIRLETGFDGIGIGDFEARSGRFEIRIPFGAEGAGGGGAAGFGSTLLGAECGDFAHTGFALAAGAARECAGRTAAGSAAPMR